MRHFFCLIFAVLLGACSKSPQALPRQFEVPPFALTERSGQPFDASAMKGKIWVVDFFFASCPGFCLELSQRMSYVKNATLDLPDVRFLSISTDEKDTPEILRAYADRLKAGDRWFFLTGEKAKEFN